jgi:hypothetical protein
LSSRYEVPVADPLHGGLADIISRVTELIERRQSDPAVDKSDCSERLS